MALILRSPHPSTLLIAAALLWGFGCQSNDLPHAETALDAPTSAADHYLAAMRANRYAQAVAIARDQLVDASDHDGAWWAYLGAAAARRGQDQADVAVDAFMRSQVRVAAGFPDRHLLALRVEALTAARLYARARTVADQIRTRFPHSSLAATFEERSLNLEERLQQGVSLDNLAWYRRRAVEAQAAGHDGLAVECIEELLLLADYVDPGAATALTLDPQLRSTLGSAYLAIGSPERALPHLRLVPEDFAGYSGALLHGMALMALGHDHEAAERLDLAARASTDPDIRAQATRVRSDIAPPLDGDQLHEDSE